MHTQNCMFRNSSRVISILAALLLLFSQNAFSGELLQVGAPKETPQTDVGKQVTSITPSTSSNDVVGVGPEKTWQIHPKFEFHTLYDTNVNRESQHKRDDDIIFSYVPSITMRRKGSKLDFNSGYQMNFEQFLKDGDQNNFNHVANTGIEWITGKLKTSLAEQFSWVTAYATSEQSERRRVMINDFRPEIAYRLTPKVSVSSVYQHYIFHYKESGVREFSYMMNDIGGRIYYHATPKLDFYVEGAGNDYDYYRSGLYDSKGYTILLGSTGKMTRKVLLNVEGGFRGQKYDDSKINSYHGAVAQGIIRYRLSPKSSVSLLGRREKDESVYEGTAFYVSNKLGLDFDYRLSPRVKLKLSGSAQQNDYPIETTTSGITKKRKDYIFAGGARMNWQPCRYLSFSAGYDFRQRDSNFDNVFDYVDHTVDTSVSYQL